METLTLAQALDRANAQAQVLNAAVMTVNAGAIMHRLAGAKIHQRR